MPGMFSFLHSINKISDFTDTALFMLLSTPKQELWINVLIRGEVRKEEFLGLNADVRAVHLHVDEKCSALLSHWCHTTALLGWQPSVVTAGLTECSAQISENKSQQTLLSPCAATAEQFIIGHVRQLLRTRLGLPAGQGSHTKCFFMMQEEDFHWSPQRFSQSHKYAPLDLRCTRVLCEALRTNTNTEEFWGWGRALSHPSQLHSTPQMHKAFHQGRSKCLSWGGRALICLLPTGKLRGRACLANSIAAFFSC